MSTRTEHDVTETPLLGDDVATSDPTMGHPTEPTETAVFDGIRGTRDALSVRRVFGEPYTADGLTVIPVARIAGGAGGGGGEGTGPGEQQGHGFGTGFGLGARPVGVYEIRDDHLKWRPTIDVDRLARGRQILVGIGAVCVTLVLLRHR